jgi:hypothetical protein
MGPRAAWLLNFEADLELAQAGAFTPSREVARLVAGLRARHAARLLRPGDVEIDEHGQLTPPERGLPGRAWCPTPRALTAIARAGALVPRAPALEVLRRVNDRAFNAALGQTLPEALHARELEALRAQLESRPRSERWLFKRAFSLAGRGQLRVDGGTLDGAALAWLRAGLRSGGLQLEPWVRIEREFSLHGLLDEAGGCEFGRLCVQECDAHGTWIDTRAASAGEASLAEREALERAAAEVAEALAAAGYFGPFGVDAFRWIDAAGLRQLQPRSEINARYTLGWRAGFPEAVEGEPGA